MPFDKSLMPEKPEKPESPWKGKPEYISKNPIYRQLWNDVYEKDLDALIAICGRRGHCKSGAAQRFGERFDLQVNGKPRFSVDNIFFKAKDFLNAMRSNKPKGTVFVWDEVGVENDSRSWYDQKNKMIKYVMETNRFKNYVVLVTLPVLKSMDISTQRLLSGYCEMHGKIGDGSKAKGKFELVQTNPKTGKMYYKAPRVFENGKLQMVDEIIVPRPSKKLEDAYKEKKKEFTDNLYEFISSELDFMSKTLGSNSDKLPDYEDLVKKVLEDIDSYYDKEKKNWKLIGFMQRFGLVQNQARQLRLLLRWKIDQGEISI